MTGLPSEILAAIPMALVAVAGYLMRNAHAEMVKRIAKLEREKAALEQETQDALRDVAVQQATIAERLGNVLERVREIRDQRRSERPPAPPRHTPRRASRPDDDNE